MASRACAPRTTHVANIDADDEMQPTRLLRMLTLMREHHADIGVHSYDRVRSERAVVKAATKRSPRHRRAGSRRFDETLNRTRPVVTSPEVLGKTDVRDWSMTHFGHNVVRASLVANMAWPEHLQVAEDVAFVRKALRCQFRVVHTDERLTIYHRGYSVQRITSVEGSRLDFAPTRRGKAAPARDVPPAFDRSGDRNHTRSAALRCWSGGSDGVDLIPRGGLAVTSDAERCSIRHPTLAAARV